MFVEKQKLRIGNGCHQEGKGLSLTSRKEFYLLCHSVLEAHSEHRKLLAEEFAVFLCNSRLQTSRLVFVIGNCQILLDCHIERRSLERVLKDPADVACSLVLRLLRNVFAVQHNASSIDRENSRNTVEKR